jgi:hypothetical protein
MSSDDDRYRAATIYTLIETAKLNDIDPEAYLRMRPQVDPTRGMSEFPDEVGGNGKRTGRRAGLRISNSITPFSLSRPRARRLPRTRERASRGLDSCAAA